MITTKKIYKKNGKQRSKNGWMSNMDKKMLNFMSDFEKKIIDFHFAND